MCQGLSDFSAPGGARVSRFGCRHVDDAARGQQRPQVLEDGHGIGDVLDRLQEHDGVKRARLPVALDEPALEPQSGLPITQPGMLVGLRIGVDADDRRGPSRQHRGPVALAAAHVEDPHAAHTRGNPLVHHEMPPVPVVLVRNVGKRALAGQRQRRHARRLVLLNMLRLGRHDRHTVTSPRDAGRRRPIRRGDPRRQRALPRHHRGRLRHQVGDRFRRAWPGPGPGQDSQAVGSGDHGRRPRGGARDRRRDLATSDCNLLQPV